MRTRALMFLAGFGMCILATGCEAPNSTSSGPSHPLVGQKAPLFTAKTLDDQPFDLAQYLGKNVVILDFWATWCGPCRRSLPTMIEVAAEYKARGVEFFAVDIEETPEQVHEFLKSTMLNLPVLLDSDGKINKLYQVKAIPQTVIIGKDGTVRVVHVGTSAELRSELTKELDELVAGKSTGAAVPDIALRHVP